MFKSCYSNSEDSNEKDFILLKVWRSPHSCGIGCLAYSMANCKMNRIYDLHNISRPLHLTCNHASKKLQGPLECLKLIFSTSVGEQLGVLKQSLRNRLHDAGLRARKPLTVEHRNRRLQFAKGRVNWNHRILSKNCFGLMNPDVVWISMMDEGARRTSNSGMEEDKLEILKPSALLNMTDFVLCQTWLGQA